MRFHKIIFQTDAENFRFISCETKKFYSQNKYDSGLSQYQNIKASFTDPIFSNSFGMDHVRKYSKKIASETKPNC